MVDETPTWPDSEARYRLRPPAESGLDALAAVLDAAPRTPDGVALRLALGRRADLFGPRRIALESLSGHPDVTVDDDHTAGTVPLTDGTFEDLAALFESLDRAVVRDGDGTAIVAWDGRTLRFALPDAAVESLRDGLDDDVADRIEATEGR
jgi:hypothetical protein